MYSFLSNKRVSLVLKCSGPGVRFSKAPKSSRARELFGTLFGHFFRVPRSVSQRARKNPGFSPDIFGGFFRVGHVLVLECFRFSPMFSYVATAVSSCSCKLTVHLCSFMNTAWQCQRCCLVLASFLSHRKDGMNRSRNRKLQICSMAA